MRHEYELGESTLGDIDPSSAAANLVLLGLRGIAASALHQNAIGYQERKDWGKLKSTVENYSSLATALCGSLEVSGLESGVQLYRVNGTELTTASIG